MLKRYSGFDLHVALHESLSDGTSLDTGDDLICTL